LTAAEAESATVRLPAITYLFILDCYSRMIVGLQLATHLRTDSVLDALEMANGLRRPAPGMIAHTDRGCILGRVAGADVQPLVVVEVDR
jgi:putative transposase